MRTYLLIAAPAVAVAAAICFIAAVVTVIVGIIRPHRSRP